LALWTAILATKISSFSISLIAAINAFMMHAAPFATPSVRTGSRRRFLVRHNPYLSLSYRSYLFFSLSDREYERSCAWFYSEAQGAITRFLVHFSFFSYS
jgi:hypothetical protein